MKRNVDIGRMTFRKLRTVWQRRRVVLGLLIGASATIAIAAGTDFRQASNENPTLGDIVWLNSILQQNNSRYFEGVSVPQRLIFTSVGATGGNVHVLALSHQVSKASSHAYDFLTSWQQAFDSANMIAPGQGILNDLFVDACGPNIGPQASTAICTALRTGGNSFAADCPDSMGVVLGANTDPHIAAYETAFGNRTITIYGNEPIASASVTFTGFAASLESAPDVDATYDLSWTSASTQILIEMAGHLAVGADNAGGPGIGWGAGLGSAAISGGPYHFKLSTLDGASLGSQDNQIKGADICQSCCAIGACDDGIDCTTDVCVEPTDCGSCVNACQHTPNNAACNDNNVCTDDACVVGIGCVFTPDDSNSCGDGAFCNGTEVCMSGTCEPGTPVDCSFLDNVCNVGVCNETTDSCEREPRPNGTVCDVGLFCTVGDVCVDGDCTGGPPRDCSDGIGCTNDSCDEATDTCVHNPGDSNCDDLLFCNGVEICDPAGGDPITGCKDGPDPCPLCTFCDEAVDTCTGCNDNACCDDLLFCNGVETCDTVTHICQPGTPVNCDDGIACTIDDCDEVNDICTYTPDHSACNDNNPCTDDACVVGVGCVFSNNSNTCDDGLFCTVGDVCMGGTCQPGATRDCSFLDDQCNVGVCDEMMDSCVRQPANNNGPCNDGLFCTVEEKCQNGTCGGGTPRDCGDGIPCTTDSCDEVLDMCVATPQDTLCDDQNPCTDDHCVVGVGCVNTPDDSNSCDDLLFCNGAETCVNGVCVDGPDPCVDTNPCTLDTCDEPTDTCRYECEIPGIICPGDLTFECDNVGDFGQPTVDDTCSVNPIVVCTEESTPGKLPQEETIIRTCTVTNKCGNTAQCMQRIDIVDTTPPVITCPLDCSLECGTVQCIAPNCDDQSCACGGEATCEDNCSTCTVSVTCEVIPGNCRPGQTAGISPPPKLTVEKTFTASDGAATVATGNTGNVAECIQHIDIVDTRPPTLQNCPIEIETCPGVPLEFTPPTCQDTCGSCTVQCTRSDGQALDSPAFPPISITCTATDECGNVSEPCVTPVKLGDCLIPTVSEWGLAVLALLLMIGAKIHFGFKWKPAA